MSTTLVVTSSWPRTEDPIAGTFVRTDAIARAREGRVVVAAPIGSGVACGGEGIEIVDVAHGGLFGSPGAALRLRADPLKIKGLWSFAVEVAKLVERVRPSKLVAHWLVPSGAVARLVATGFVEMEVVAHGGDVRILEALPRFVARRIVEAVVDRATLRAVSASLAERIARIAPSVAAFTVVAPMPLATDDPGVCETARSRGRELANSGARPLHVVASRLVRGKPIVRAVDHVADRGGRLVVLGDGPQRRAIADHAARRRVALELLGALPHDEALAWIAAADVVLAPIAPGEGAPTVVREARALGRTVIALA